MSEVKLYRCPSCGRISWQIELVRSSARGALAIGEGAITAAALLAIVCTNCGTRCHVAASNAGPILIEKI